MNNNSQKSSSPLIGITLDSEEASEMGYSKFPYYALRENYASVVVKAGGVPVILPHEPSLIGTYLDIIDGLIITGGNFDVDPSMYGDHTTHETVTLKSERTQFETDITRGALELDMPILGICGGQQLLNVVLGGTLIQHIPDEIAAPLAHEQPNPRNEPGHIVTVEEGTLLYDIVGSAEMNVNSAHHQAVKAVSGSAIVNARTADGVIEGIEAPRQKFCLGVQWHPEFEIDPGDGRIFAAFIDAAR
ncbi:MAG: gamma-glutamyl-gamma-aminobutyrate hydrolase family protein [Rhodospirillaceae bacterium]|jgi:putative glutamine amidotransferase|nr:gamma-glutamyl-gamma-aminobutyrate hydrolase family protein [Rhodospirillaceae bacterium]MBT4589595.1 gamma-glutamyl-gamma-aminobutyrate hydrolase family protein [Rhodospirillaceae bacterium]MBT4939577.1 gamma-glutamyl-gamma-aminobutyrate hydrolase family protein [Rhodospirillaceae bacterium]MBT7266867.1 gamma-glutamyl-gamma-aminobutyrate hydrolase family protein [Rhodospirillaceae bacterium]